jgi:hypothetical protein
MARFPPGKGGGEGVARGGKGKGILIHTLTDAAGMPVANCTTPANGDERAQVLPLLDALKVRTGRPGRPRKRFKVLATDKGYDAKTLRQQLQKRGMRAQIPKRVWKTTKPRGRPLKKDVPRVQSGADLRLVPEEISAVGCPLGAPGAVFRCVSCHRHNSHLGPKVNSGIDS